MVVVELPLEIANTAIFSEPDRESSLIYEHLEHYCSKFAKNSPLPAITVSEKGGELGIVRGHKYLQVANKLGIGSIRAIVTDGADAGVVKKLLESGNARQLDSGEIGRELHDTQVIEGWHVFYFESELSREQQKVFENQIVGFFRSLTSPLLAGRLRKIDGLRFLGEGRSCEFRASTPVGDPSWFPLFHSACLTFHREVARIASYQGRRFVDG